MEMRQLTALRAKFPDRVPIIVWTTLPLDKKKYLVATDFNIGQLMCVIRMRLALEPSQALFVVVITKDDTRVVPLPSDPISMYDEGGIVYLSVFTENTFG
jgi:hypothetical protein